MTTRKSIFKMVNLRGVDNNTVEPPTDPDDGDDGPIIEIIRNSSTLPHIDNDQAQALSRQLENQSIDNLIQLTDAVDSLVTEEKVNNTSELVDKSLQFADKSLPLAKVAAQESFQTEYRNLYNRWLLARLRPVANADITELESRLRTAHLINVLGDPNRQAPANVHELMVAQIVFPRHQTQETAASSTHRTEPVQSSPSDESRYQTLTNKIKSLDSIEATLIDKWAKKEQNDEEVQEHQSITGGARIGFIEKVKNWLFGNEPELTTTTRTREPQIDEKFIEDLKTELPDNAALLVDELLKGQSLTVVQAQKKVADTNKAFTLEGSVLHDRISAARFTRRRQMPPSTIPPIPEKLEYAVKAIGWGDLIVATERLVNYQANEIAHIENVLPGEEKTREHSRRRTVEETIETETIEENESERELETTDRYELQSESEKAIETDFSVDAGVNTSGRYGLTKVETSLDVDFTRSQSESRSVTTNVAKEVVDKAIERTLKKSRELRRRSVVTEIIELNHHGIKNLPATANSSVSAISGIYRWVEKIHEVQLRHYGKRMMLEFHIPEPAITLASTPPSVELDIDEPPDFTLTINQLNETNYKIFAQRYRATDMEEPPEREVEIGYAWQSTPDEGTDEDKAEDTIAEKIVIPSGYSVYRVSATIYAHPAKARFFKVRLAIGGRTIVWEPQSGTAKDTYNKSVYFSGTQIWPDGLPVSMLAHGHFDKTLAVNIRVYCKRSNRSFNQWKLHTHEKLNAAYRARLVEYQDAVAESEFDQNLSVNIDSRPEVINRRTEREELKKWSIKTFRNKVIDFRAIADVDSVNEVDPNAADDNARPIQFYEEAFEWEQMSYFFYPYFWGRREFNDLRRSFTNIDARFETFLRAGAARVIVPVTPGYEKRIIMYLTADNTLTEIEKISLASDISDEETPIEVEASEYKTLWIELLQDRKDGVALGSGTLSVINGNTRVDINADSIWEIREIDIGREIFIRGNRYEIVQVDSASNAFELDNEYQGEDENSAVYVTGSVPFGPSWTVNLPTNLVVLDENKERVSME